MMLMKSKETAVNNKSPRRLGKYIDLYIPDSEIPLSRS